MSSLEVFILKPLERQSPDQVEEHCWGPRGPPPWHFYPISRSQLRIKSVAYGFLKSRNHSGTRQELSVLTSGEVLNASMSVPTLCDVALAPRLHVGVPSAVCVAEQVCVIPRAGPQDEEASWDLPAPLKAGDR